MRVDVLARRWGGPDGGPDGMAVAVSFLAYTLCQLGHEVHCYTAAAGDAPWQHQRATWHLRPSLVSPDDATADLIITTIQPSLHRLRAWAAAAGALGRIVYWHHHDGIPADAGVMVAAPPAFPAAPLCLPPSSWAVEAGGEVTGDAVLVPGAGATKGGYIAAQVAFLCPELRWFVLPCRHAPHDLLRWRELRNADIASGPMPPPAFLSRARAVLSPTRAEVHPLALVEAAVRGIPVVCTDLPGTRAALGASAVYVPEDAPAREWADALRRALASPTPRLRLPPYREVVAGALAQLWAQRRAA